MKVFKRNAIILTMIVFICAAVYLNWAYNKTDKSVSAVPTAVTNANKGTDKNASKDVDKNAANNDEKGAGLYYTKSSTDVSDYFAAVRLERKQARDTAMSTLNTAVETMSISQQARDNAVTKISDLSGAALRESEMESMIKAKGFSDCVVFLKDTAVIVTVASPKDGLNDTSVAQIADIILQETEMTLDQIRINEVK